VASDKWSLAASAIDLELKEPFSIATETWDVARNVFVTVRHGAHRGRGEVGPDARWGESPESVVRALESLDLSRLRGAFDLETSRKLLGPGAARCALDIALHDLAAQTAGVSVAELLGCGGRPLPPTSVTVAITDLDSMLRRAEALRDHPVLKIKVGFEGDVEVVRSIRSVYEGALRIDANEGWPAGEAADRLQALEGYDIELCEQPIARGDREGLARVTASTSIPVFADEDVATAEDVARLAGVVDGVNVKLRKAGGPREAVKAIATARAHGMGAMLGCDLESGIAATAEASLACLVDFADLDGPLLLAEDPFPGVTYDRGQMALPPGPGLGVRGWPHDD